MPKLYNASTLILAANHIKGQTIKILALKRASEVSHMPNAYVFPGGNHHAADEHPDWLSLLSQHECDVKLNIVGFVDESSDIQISKAVSTRITAIRETFEECGILICRHKNDSCCNKINDYNIVDKNIWRKKVHNDPYEFLNLCRTFECFPNIKGLYLFSNWITPKIYPRRYDCKFFIAIMDQVTEGKADNIEIKKVEWQSVNYFIENNSIFLPPPQVYELNKLKMFKNIETLSTFIVDVDSNECSPFIPIHAFTSDGMIIILPGDEKYDELFDETRKNTLNFNYNINEFRGNIMHRLEYRNMPDSSTDIKLVIQNCYPKYQNFFSIKCASNSKL